MTAKNQQAASKGRRKGMTQQRVETPRVIDGVSDHKSSNPASLSVARRNVNSTGGARVSTTHGLYASELPEHLQHLRAEIAQFEAACVADDGGESEIPTRRRSLIHLRARVERRARQ